jgi:hypothetical protein
LVTSLTFQTLVPVGDVLQAVLDGVHLPTQSGAHILNEPCLTDRADHLQAEQLDFLAIGRDLLGGLEALIPGQIKPSVAKTAFVLALVVGAVGDLRGGVQLAVPLGIYRKIFLAF